MLCGAFGSSTRVLTARQGQEPDVDVFARASRHGEIGHLEPSDGVQAPRLIFAGRVVFAI